MSYSIEQQMLTLSYISYCGYSLIGSDRHNARKIAPQVVQNLEEELPTKNQWRLVWGPAVDELLFTLFDDNMAYIVQHIEHPNRFAIVFRGTNPISLSDWIFEDFLVLRKYRWKVGKENAPGGAKISHGTHIAMHQVKDLEAPSGVPGAGTTMLQFLRIQAETQYKPLEIYVTGHSLGSTIATTAALFLKQTAGKTDIPVGQQWDPDNSSTIKTYGFAGATAGNKAFSEFSDSLLDDKHLFRVANSLDIVPHAWNKETISQLHNLYEPVAKAKFAADLVIGYAKLVSILCDYTQPQAQQPFLTGTLSEPCKDYFQQAIYQHVVAYPTLLGLEGGLDPLKYFPILKDVLPCYHESEGNEGEPSYS